MEHKAVRQDSADERYTVFIEDLNTYWKHFNRVPFSFGAGDGKAVKTFLSNNPRLERPEFQDILRNRAKSEAVCHSLPIRYWIGKCLQYANGPLDQYGHPKGANGNGRLSPAQQRADRIRANTFGTDGNGQTSRRLSTGDKGIGGGVFGYLEGDTRKIPD